jgi:hypothetical protein
MRHVATGQITLLDSNDYLSTGLTAPSNPVAGVTLWVDTSVTPNQLKKWNGTAWEIVSDAQAAIDKAKQDAINDAAQKYVTNSTFSSNVTQLSDRINTKVSQTDFNALGTRVGNAETKITQQSTLISAKAEKTDLSALSTRVSNAEAKITPDAINLTVKSQITTAVNDIQIGGRNLLALTNILYGTRLDTGVRGKFWASTIWSAEYILSKFEASTQYTIKYLVTINSLSSLPLYSGAIGFSLYNGTSSIPFYAPSSLGVGDTYEVQKTFITPADLTNYRLLVYTKRFTDGATVELGDMSFTNLKIEKGNKATDWTPAPEDVDASIALRPTTEEIKSQFTMDSSGISMMGKKIALTGLITFSSLASDAQTKITTAQSTANQALGSISNLSADIGAMAYYDNVSLAKLDSTIVEGGYIKTSLIDANAIITGSLLAAKIAATDITTTRLTVSEGCTVGGFSIGSNRIGISASPDNVGSDGMFLYSSMIGFNAGNRQAIVGTYNTLGTTRLGQFIDTTSNYLPNVGIAFDIRSTNNGNRNYAFLGNGNGVLNGFVSGYGFREYSFAANNQYSVVGTLTSEFILVYFNYSNCAIVLPTLASMCDTLGISYTRAFTVRLTVINTAGNSGKLYGRSSSGISGISGYNYPQLRDWNNAVNNGGWDISEGDSYELCLFYDGSSTGSVPGRSDAYRAYIINRQN